MSTYIIHPTFSNRTIILLSKFEKLKFDFKMNKNSDRASQPIYELGVSSDLERPMKKSRKPSVLVSRQFSCSGALNLQRLNPILSKKNGKEEEQLLIENRKNVTPLPLMSRDLPSIEEINIDQDEYSYDSDSSCLEHIKMSWVPKLLDQIMGESKNQLLFCHLFNSCVANNPFLLLS